MSDVPDEFSLLNAVVLPIEDTLDLHTFHPREVNNLIPDYLEACRQQGILRVRIIHGKGKGFLREKVHGILRRLHEVADFHLSDREGGDWGSTIVVLRPLVSRQPGGDASLQGMTWKPDKG